MKTISLKEWLLIVKVIVVGVVKALRNDGKISLDEALDIVTELIETISEVINN